MSVVRNVSRVGIAGVMMLVLSREARAQVVSYDVGAGPARFNLDLCASDACARAQAARDVYDSRSKSVVAALALELFVFPGLPDASEPEPRVQGEAALHFGLLMGGAVLGVASRIFGIYNAVHATKRHNEQLQTILGLTLTLSLAAPLPESPNSTATVLPGLTARF